MNRFLAKIASPFIRKAEGDAHPGPWQLPVTGGWLPSGVGDFWNWWQMGYDPMFGTSSSAIVEACQSAYSQTVAMCPGDHWRASHKGGRIRITNSALARILRYPNDYQSISDFMLNLTRSLYEEGNAYALALRNSRFEIDELHLMDARQSRPLVAETGDVFYQLYGNDVIQRRLGNAETQLLVPMRDVLHVRLNTNKQYPTPMIGQPPLMAAMSDIAVGSAITQQQIQFYMNEARPSAVLTTDLVLDKEQVQSLRDRWNEQAKGLKQGGTPILTGGLKVQPWGVAGNKDSSLSEVLKMSKENVALVYRIPLQVLGLGGTSYTSVEVLMQAWISMGLGFALNHIEEAFGQVFQLDGQPKEYVEFSTSVLLRSAEKDRMESLVKAVQGGIYSPNEARNKEGLDDVEFGDEPRVQQQVVPLSAAGKIPAPPSPHAAPPAPPPKGSDDVKREVRNVRAVADRRRRLSAGGVP